MFIGICSRSQLNVYRTIGPLVCCFFVGFFCRKNTCILLLGVGSWDESDADERTLRDVRSNFSKEKLKEEEKQLRLKEMEGV